MLVVISSLLFTSLTACKYKLPDENIAEENVSYTSLAKSELTDGSTKQYIDSLIFKLNFNKEDNRFGLEPSQISPENVKISPEIFMHTLQQFIKILSHKKGIDMSLWVKKFIKKIEYCRDEIAVTAYYRENPEEVIAKNDASTGRNNGSECMKWLPEQCGSKNF